MSPTRTHSTLKELSIASGRELLRNGKSFFGLTAIFLFFLAIVSVLQALGTVDHPQPIVSISSSVRTPEIVKSLAAQGVEVASSEVKANAAVSVNGDRAFVELRGTTPPRWGSVVRSLEDSGIASNRVIVRDEYGSIQRDTMRANLSAVLVSGLVAIAFAGTTVPLVALRQRGTLRLLGTTPVGRLVFLLAQTPIRFLLGLAEGLVVLAIALWQGYLHSGAAYRLPVTFALGFAMFFAFALLLAGRSSNPDLMLQIVGIVPVIVLLGSGTLVPLDGLPAFVIWISDILPSTWFMQAINADLTGAEPFVDTYVLWILMCVATATALAIAVKAFRWDQGDL